MWCDGIRFRSSPSSIAVNKLGDHDRGEARAKDEREVHDLLDNGRDGFNQIVHGDEKLKGKNKEMCSSAANSQFVDDIFERSHRKKKTYPAIAQNTRKPACTLARADVA